MRKCIVSKLNVDKKTIKSLFQETSYDFLIPDYQRPYAWTETECLTLWDDLKSFCFPEDDALLFNANTDSYFLGPIVTFKNSDNKLEVIDGQQRLTTIMLLLRAFYEKYGKMKDTASQKIKENIERCIWKTDELDAIKKDELKIVTLVATDEDKEEFVKILNEGIVGSDSNSKYAINYKFFKGQIDQFLTEYPVYAALFPNRIMSNCILLPIEAEDQDTALRIFSTLNDRGLPLADSDIFKAKLYKHFSKNGSKDDFISRWKELEEICSKCFKNTTGSPMDELFSRYMYYERALKGIKLSTTESLRKFYENNKLLETKPEEILDNLELLATFWNSVSSQNSSIFTSDVLKKLFVLNYGPNNMWANILSVYYMQNKNAEGKLDNEKLLTFLSKIIAFTFAYAITYPGVNALRTPVYAEMVNIVNGKDVEFSDYKFSKEFLTNQLNTFPFYNGRPITKSILTWWAYQNPDQKLYPLDSSLDIEHIYAKKRYELTKGLSKEDYLEVLGNKSLLEKRINIRASDYKFSDKCKYYTGQVLNKKGEQSKPTEIEELLSLVTKYDESEFNEADIIERNKEIINKFISYVEENNLIKVNSEQSTSNNQ